MRFSSYKIRENHNYEIKLNYGIIFVLYPLYHFFSYVVEMGFHIGNSYFTFFYFSWLKRNVEVIFV